MKLEKFKAKEKLKISIIIIGCMSFLSMGYFISRTFASYQERESFNLMEGIFDYYQGSDVYFAFYNGDTQANTIPSKDSKVIFDSEKSNCTNGTSIE